MAAMLPELEVLTVQCELKSRRSGVLPGVLHSTVRGAFGHALKRLAGQVDELGSSPYERVFEGAPYPGRAGLIRGAMRKAPPPPFIVRCPIEGSATHPRQRRIEPGSAVRFGLTLLGFACDELQPVILAIEDAAESGLGEDRIPFELHAVRCMTQNGPVALNLNAGSRPAGPSLGLLESATPLTGLAFQLITPLQIRSGGKIIARPDAAEFLRAVQRRLLALEAALSPEPRQGHPLLPPEAELAWGQVEEAQLGRLSARQKRRLELRGIVGQGELRSKGHCYVDALLLAAAVIGVGHGTTQGCGQLRVPVAEPLLACFGAAHP